MRLTWDWCGTGNRLGALVVDVEAISITLLVAQDTLNDHRSTTSALPSTKFKIRDAVAYSMKDNKYPCTLLSGDFMLQIRPCSSCEVVM